MSDSKCLLRLVAAAPPSNKFVRRSGLKMVWLQCRCAVSYKMCQALVTSASTQEAQERRVEV
eukprot:9083236-Ditylum_brightwellii.AAC.1